MRPSLTSRDSDPHHTIAGPENHSSPQGRGVPVQHSEKVSLLLSPGISCNSILIPPVVSPTNQQPILASGRGGVGNAHSPSRGAAVETRNALREEARLVRERARGGSPVRFLSSGAFS